MFGTKTKSNSSAHKMFRRSSESKISLFGVTEANGNAACRPVPTKSIANKLFHHIQAGDWELAMDRLNRKPSDIQERYLFLHEALKHNAPLAVVEALHRARPDAVYHQEHKHQRMALHVACACGLSVQIVKYLHQQFKDATKHPSSGGMLPLHLACASSDCDFSVLTYLLAAYPQAVEERDSMGLTALDYATRSGNPLSDILIRELERGYPFWSGNDVNNPTSCCNLPSLLCEAKWEAALERLSLFPEESIMWSVYKEKRYLPIHYACMFLAPLEVVSELAEIHPYGLELTCQDENRTALHLACHHGAHFSVVNVLLGIHIDAASYTDDLGLLPLHLARVYHSKNAAPVDAFNCNAVIQAVLQAYPMGASYPMRASSSNLSRRLAGDSSRFHDLVGYH